MKSLIKNYVNKLTKEKLDGFAKKKNIFLTDNELEYLLSLIQNNIDNILKNDEEYIENIKENISTDNFNKIFKLYTYYKNKYIGYLF